MECLSDWAFVVVVVIVGERILTLIDTQGTVSCLRKERKRGRLGFRPLDESMDWSSSFLYPPVLSSRSPRFGFSPFG